MTGAWRWIARTLTGSRALPAELRAERLDQCWPLERLEVWGGEQPTLVRVPYWLQR